MGLTDNSNDDDECDGRPVIVEVVDASGAWKAASFNNSEMTQPAVYPCLHCAQDNLALMAVHAFMLIKRGELEMEEMPRRSQYRFTYVDQVPAEHDLPEEVVVGDAANDLINAIKGRA